MPVSLLLPLLLLLSLHLLPTPVSSFSTTFSDCTSALGPLSPSNQSLFIQWYNNTAFAPQPSSGVSSAPYQTVSSYSYTSSLAFHFPSALPSFLVSSPTFSFQVQGHLLAPATALYSFQCLYDPTFVQALLWVDDHLLCPTDANNVNQSIHATAGQLLHLRLDAIQQRPYTYQFLPHLDVRWQVGNTSSYTPPPPAALIACLPPPRLAQTALHSSQLQTGWDALYNPDVMTPTLLPHGLGLQLALYRMSTGEFRGNVSTERAINGTLTTTLFGILNRTWVGDERPYLSFGLVWGGMQVRVEETSARGNDSLTMVVEGQGKANWSDYRLILLPKFLWGRQGDCPLTGAKLPSSPFAVCRASGISPDVAVFANTAIDARHYAGINETIYGSDFVGFRFPDTSSSSPPTFVLTTGVPREADAARAVTAAALASASFDSCVDPALVAYAATPAPVEQCNLMQATLAWLTVYTPYEGIVLVVSRRWDFGFGYVLFEWDSFFSVVMLSSLRSPLAKQVLLSTYLQVVKTRTITPDGLGFIPNYASGTIASRDRTEPPIGARTLLSLLHTYTANDTDMRWLIPLTFPDLHTETSWFFAHRRIAPLGLIGLGSDPNPPIFGDIEYNDMQAARYESGLDNSPMYDDDALFNNQTHLMEQYDVGMTALTVAACASLLQLVDGMGGVGGVGVGDEVVADLKAKVTLMGGLTEQLWDDRQGIYVNVRARDGMYSRRLSPTSFFPMIAGLPSVAQAEGMVVQHLQNRDEFCVGEDCLGQPLPSIARSDANYTDQTYWRGRQWGPHTMLVWWGLTHTAYEGSAVIGAARTQLAKQADEVWKFEWRTFHHVHENYDGDSAVGCNTGNSDPLYSWGALNPYVAVLEWTRQAEARKAEVEGSGQRKWGAMEPMQMLTAAGGGGSVVMAVGGVALLVAVLFAITCAYGVRRRGHSGAQEGEEQRMAMRLLDAEAKRAQPAVDDQPSA